MDMDAFFAAVELKRRPELTGKPVVIGGEGDPQRRGVVSTASYEARKYGVHSAMPLRTAYNLCPHAVFLPVDYGEYVRVSRIIKKTLREFSDLLEDVGIDEAFLDISAIDQTSESIGTRIKERVHEVTGLTCSVGIGPNKLVAKIASDLQKPDGLTIVSEQDVQSRIWPLSARKLWGVGPKTEARLKAMGIETVGQLAGLPLETLVSYFGNSYGTFLHQSARGIDESPLVTHWEPKSISRETTFENDVTDWQAIARTLAALTKDTVASMEREGNIARTVTIKIRFSDFTTVTRAKTLEEATASLDAIRHGAFDCLKRVDLARRRVRLIGVRLGNFEQAHQAPAG